MRGAGICRFRALQWLPIWCTMWASCQPCRAWMYMASRAQSQHMPRIFNLLPSFPLLPAPTCAGWTSHTGWSKRLRWEQPHTSPHCAGCCATLYRKLAHAAVCVVIVGPLAVRLQSKNIQCSRCSSSQWHYLTSARRLHAYKPDIQLFCVRSAYYFGK